MTRSLGQFDMNHSWQNITMVMRCTVNELWLTTQKTFLSNQSSFNVFMWFFYCKKWIELHSFCVLCKSHGNAWAEIYGMIVTRHLIEWKNISNVFKIVLPIILRSCRETNLSETMGFVFIFFDKSTLTEGQVEKYAENDMWSECNPHHLQFVNVER